MTTHPALLLTAGVLIGAATTLASANLWPHARMAPTLFSENDLRFGRATNGAPALCDKDNRAYVPVQGGSGLAYLSVHKGGSIVALSCADARG